MNKRPSIYLGQQLADLIAAYRGDLSDPSVSGIINTIADRYIQITQDATPALTESEWSCICDCLNGCSLLIGSGGYDGAQMVWAEIADSGQEVGDKWGLDIMALANELRGLPLAGRVAVWDIAAKFWASPQLNDLPTRELLVKVGAKIKEE